MKRIFCIMGLLNFYSPSSSQNQQDVFIIGTWRDPLLKHSESISFYNLQQVKHAKDAYFNLLTGHHYCPPLASTKSQDSSHNKLYLEICDSLGMKYMVVDDAYKGWDANGQASYRPQFFLSYSSRQSARNYMIDFYKNRITTDQRMAMFGFSFGDEPNPVDSNPLESSNLKKWVKFTNNQDRDKFTFINLYPAYAPFFGSRDDPNRKINYENYLNHYLADETLANNFQVFSFDHYPFDSTAGEGFGGFRSDYFYNLRKIKEKVGPRSFWSLINTTKSTGTIGQPVLVEPQEAHLRFSAFCPIAYGAKGLAYYYYQGNNTDQNDGLAPENYSDTSIEKLKYKKVQNINHFIRDIIGPVVMNSSLIGTYHKDNTYLNIPVNTIRIFEFLPNELLSSDTTIIKDVSSRDILFGIFADNNTSDTIEYYIFIVNKSLATIYNTVIELNGNFLDKVLLSPRVGETEVIGGVPPYHENPTSTYTSPNDVSLKDNSDLNPITTFTIPHMRGGEGRFIKILNGGTSYVLSNHND